MSHYTVLTLVSPELLARFKEENSSEEGAVKAAVDHLLRPYQEYDGQDHLFPYLKFESAVDEVEEEVNRIIDEVDDLPNFVGKTMGEYYLDIWEKDRGGTWDELVAAGYPPSRKEDVTPHDIIAVCYFGCKCVQDGGKVKYGHYHNPNGNWDWYQIGGRWTGSLPVKRRGQGTRGTHSRFTEAPKDPKLVDMCRIRELDFDHMEENTRQRIEDFWPQYQSYLETGGDPLYGVHYALMDMGIEWTNKEDFLAVKVHNRKIEDAKKGLRFLSMSDKEIDALGHFEKGDYRRFLKGYDGDEEALKALATRSKMELPRCVYGRVLTKEDLETEYRWYFEWSTYAVLDEEGWHAKGEMGWWGMSSDNAEDRENWSKSFFDRFIRSRDPDTYLVVVDCHI